MRWHDIDYLFAVIVWLPLLLYLIGAALHKKHRFLKQFSPSQQSEIVITSTRLLWTRRMVLFTALFLFTIAIARPQVGGDEVQTSAEGIDVAVVFDVSLSMLAEDEQGARYLKGRNMLIDAISSLKGDRVALIPFAGAAFMQLPLTADYHTLTILASQLEPGMIQKQGSSINDAVNLAVDTLTHGNQQSDRLLVIISDGEDPKLSMDQIKERLTTEKIHLAIMPIGTVEGAPIRVDNSYVKDSKGENVISQLNTSFFRECISNLSAEEIKRGDTLASYINSFKNRTKEDNKRIVIYKERYQLPLFVGLLSFILFTVLVTRKRRKR
ncbi:VWA domain-containing protein [bacterium]|nr:VWA domain-containing protein [bacterium]